MSVTCAYITPPEIWILLSSLSFILLVLNARLLFKEYQTRKAARITITSKHLELWSILSMILGPPCLLSLTLRKIPGFCFILFGVTRLIAYAQPTGLGFHQLSRLHYCFARKKVYSNKGYSNWLFIIMFGWSIIVYSVTSFICIEQQVVSCGINNGYQAYKNYQYLIQED